MILHVLYITTNQQELVDFTEFLIEPNFLPGAQFQGKCIKDKVGRGIFGKYQNRKDFQELH